MSIRHWLLATIATITTSGAPYALAQDCEQARQLHRSGIEAIAAYNDMNALALFKQAALACNTHQYWQSFGEHAVELSEDGESDAAEAFVAAYEIASNPDEESRSAAHYAVLLLHSGDPQRALGYIREARALNDEDAYIKTWYPRISERAQQLSAQDVVRGLGSIAFKPMRLKKQLDQSEIDGSSNQITDGVLNPIAAQKQTSLQETVSSDDGVRRIEIPLNFETNSSLLDQETASNVNLIGTTIANPAFSKFSFKFVGHADIRGEAGANMALSSARARTITNAVIASNPNLSGRIEAIGRGELEPIALGSDEESHRANRRLQIIAKAN